MRRLFALCCVTLHFLCTTTTIRAQSATKTFVSTDGSFSFIYPSGWSIAPSPQGKAYVSNYPMNESPPPNDLQLEINFPKTFAEYEQSGLGGTPLAITQAMLTAWRDAPPIRVDYEGVTTLTPIPTPPIFATKASIHAVETTINGRPAAQGSYYDAKLGTEIVRLLLVLDVGNSYCVVIYATSLNGGRHTLSSHEPIVKAIAQSIRFDAAKHIPRTPTADPFKVSGERLLTWATELGTLKFVNAEGWFFVQTAGDNYIQNTPDRIEDNQLTLRTMRAALRLPHPVRYNYLWDQVVKKGWHDLKDDEEIFQKLDCKAVAPEITAAVIIASYLPSPEEQNRLFQQEGTRFEKPQNIRLGNKDVTVLCVSGTAAEALILAVDMTRGDVVTLSAVTLRGQLKYYEDKLLEVASTFQYTRSPRCQPT
jgi:hypothetical protein